MLLDQEQRQQASDPERSFIVQAPAGSGKTEILTQRFLRLLSVVNSPEQIIALTFTRKAANEMRERIMTALKNAEMGLIPSSDHQKRTLDYANQALARNRALNWNLTQQPARLRIMTIDALCQFITQAIPLQEKEIPYAAVSEQSLSHCIHAANNCIDHALADPNYQSALQQLLLHLDNQQQRLIELFTALLSKREQWLQLIYEGQGLEKSDFEQALQFIEQHALKRFHASLNSDLAARLVQIASKTANIENNPESARYLLKQWTSFQSTDAATAKALACLLFNAKGDSFRKAFDHHVGLKKDYCDAETFAKVKAESQRLLEELTATPDFFEALSAVRNLPPPVYDEKQWGVLNALFHLLPLLAAHLQVVFAEHHQVDFSAIAHQALMALGTEEAPTDLALYLDHSIHHLLIDEFQDTSITQFRLIEQLSAGWQAGDGKTLFVVGDPMQSIYRFRQAEVGLFLRAQQAGIGEIKLKPLYLQCNFRSKPSIVHWVNQHFKQIFPQQADIESGAVPFSEATAVLDKDAESSVKAMYYPDQPAEAAGLLAIISQLLQEKPEESIAILVRSRNQLRYIVQRLREAEIPFQGVEIDLLSQLPHIKDIWTLSQCLLMPGNRLAWLALLRSPYVGLSLRDIHQIAQVNPSASIYGILSNQAAWQDLLSEAAVCRLNFVLPVLDKAIKKRYQFKLAQWIKQTAEQLHAHHIHDTRQQADLEQFWRLLDQYETDGQIEDYMQFEVALNQLYSKQATPSKLQIMTIHKSKGLEFDHVVLPGLCSAAKNPDRPLLRWLKLPTKSQGQLLLMSPVKAASEDNDPLYDYLAELDQQKDHYELQRLLYVATTRAKKCLYLLDYKEKAPSNSFRALLAAQDFEAVLQTTENGLNAEKNQVFHLPQAFYQEAKQKPVEASRHFAEAIEHSDGSLIGIISHQLLQWICDNHPEDADKVPWHLALYALKQQGFDKQQQQAMLARIQHWIRQIFDCPRGRWIIQRHEGEQNEFPLLIERQQQLQTRIIDRLFLEDKRLWIIDFKTGSEQEERRQQYMQQLNDYAAIMRYRSDAEIHCGLYYLASQQWHSWQPAVEKA